MGEFLKNDAHVAEAEARLLSQEVGSTNLRALMGLIVARYQGLEDALYPLVTDRTLVDGVGDALDQWGDLVGEPRFALTDDEYRRVIQVRILVNLSNGTPERLLTILSALVAPFFTARLLEAYPGAISFSYTRSTPLSAAGRERLTRLLQLAAASGVQIDWVIEGGNPVFAFEGHPEAAGFDVGAFGETL